MAASVDRQYHTAGINGVVRTPFTTQRSDSPIRGVTFNPPANGSTPNPSIKTADIKLVNNNGYLTDSDDEEINNWDEFIKRANSELEPSSVDTRDEGTADHWIERNPSMIRLTGKHPFNSEPPLTRLMHHGFITPVPLHYVRNHGAVPKAKWEDWSIEVTGLVKRPTRMSMEQLVNEFESKEFPATLVCAGNRRKEQNMVQQSIGFNWGSAAISTSVWRGVPLRDVLKRCGILTTKKGAMNVCFEGAEDLPGGGGSKYGTSIKREFAMDPALDIMLAYLQNGEKLSPDHGYPVRMIIPGFIGGRMVKWLKRIIVTTAESENYYHYKDNRVLPSHVDAELANSQGKNFNVHDMKYVMRLLILVE